MKGFRKARLLVGIGAVLLFIGVAFVATEGKVAMSKLSGKPVLDYNTAIEAEYSDGREFSGTLYEVYDCIAEGYTEYTDTNTTKTDSYYYLVDCPYSTADTMMIMKIDADTAFETSVDELWEAFYYAETEKEFESYALPFTGVVTMAESEVMDLAKEWRTENEWDDVKISAYMLDTTASVSGSVRVFLVGVGCLALFVAYIVIIILVFVKGKGKKQPEYAGYAPNTFGQQNNSFVPQQPPMAQPQNNSFIPQSQTVQPQNNNAPLNLDKEVTYDFGFKNNNQ